MAAHTGLWLCPHNLTELVSYKFKRETPRFILFFIVTWWDWMDIARLLSHSPQPEVAPWKELYVASLNLVVSRTFKLCLALVSFKEASYIAVASYLYLMHRILLLSPIFFPFSPFFSHAEPCCPTGSGVRVRHGGRIHLHVGHIRERKWGSLEHSLPLSKMAQTLLRMCVTSLLLQCGGGFKKPSDLVSALWMPLLHRRLVLLLTKASVSLPVYRVWAFLFLTSFYPVSDCLSTIARVMGTTAQVDHTQHKRSEANLLLW